VRPTVLANLTLDRPDNRVERPRTSKPLHRSRDRSRHQGRREAAHSTLSIGAATLRRTWLSFNVFAGTAFPRVPSRGGRTSWRKPRQHRGNTAKPLAGSPPGATPIGVNAGHAGAPSPGPARHDASARRSRTGPDHPMPRRREASRLRANPQQDNRPRGRRRDQRRRRAPQGEPGSTRSSPVPDWN
jgi:hypothetical protein